MKSLLKECVELIEGDITLDTIKKLDRKLLKLEELRKETQTLPVGKIVPLLRGKDAETDNTKLKFVVDELRENISTSILINNSIIVDNHIECTVEDTFATVSDIKHFYGIVETLTKKYNINILANGLREVPAPLLVKDKLSAWVDMNNITCCVNELTQHLGTASVIRLLEYVLECKLLSIADISVVAKKINITVSQAQYTEWLIKRAEILGNLLDVVISVKHTNR